MACLGDRADAKQPPHEGGTARTEDNGAAQNTGAGDVAVPKSVIPVLPGKSHLPAAAHHLTAYRSILLDEANPSKALSPC